MKIAHIQIVLWMECDLFGCSVLILLYVNSYHMVGKRVESKVWPHGIFFFFFFDNRQYYIFKEKGTPQSTLQASKRTTGRLCLLKQKDWTLLMESFATTWATALQSLLTQENRQDLKDYNRRRILLIKALISQWGWMEGCWVNPSISWNFLQWQSGAIL